MSAPALETCSAARVPAASSGAGRGAARRDVKFHLIWLAISVVVIFLSGCLTVRDGRYVLIPGTQTPLPESCSFKRLTGIACAGCGLTRSFISLGHGDWAAAWNYNRCGIPLYACILFQIPFRLTQIIRIRRGGNELSLGWWGQGAIFLCFGLMLVQWAAHLAGWI